MSIVKTTQQRRARRGNILGHRNRSNWSRACFLSGNGYHRKVCGTKRIRTKSGRCAIRVPTVRFYLCGHLQRDTHLQAQGKVYSESGDKFLSMSESVKPFSQEFALEQFGRMTEAYKQRWLRAKALSGNFSDDPVIRSDMQLCSTLAIS